GGGEVRPGQAEGADVVKRARGVGEVALIEVNDVRTGVEIDAREQPRVTGRKLVPAQLRQAGGVEERGVSVVRDGGEGAAHPDRARTPATVQERGVRVGK